MDGGLRDLRSLWWLPIALQIGAILTSVIFALVVAVAATHYYGRLEIAEKERATLKTALETQDVWLHNNDRRMERLLGAVERAEPDALADLRDTVKEIRAEIRAERTAQDQDKE
jgi:uncharacterized protein (DUF2236 family)